MKITYNFRSLVAVGNFNPAILTPDFLNKICKLNLGEPIKIHPPQLLPIYRHFEFKDLHFTLDLERLEIKEPVVGDISKTNVLRIFKTYYSKLPHTPLTAAGVNIRCDLKPKNDKKSNIVAKKIRDPRFYLDFFKADKIDYNERSFFEKNDKIWVASNYHIENIQGLTRRINTQEMEGSFNVNYNCEAGNLTENETKLDMLLKGYSKFYREFLRFVKFLEGN